MSSPVLNEFLVLGDLGPVANDKVAPGYTARNTYILRMFVGEQTFDEEISCYPEEIESLVTVRMDELAAAPDKSLLVEAARPRVHPGNAIDVPMAEAVDAQAEVG